MHRKCKNVPIVLYKTQFSDSYLSVDFGLIFTTKLSINSSKYAASAAKKAKNYPLSFEATESWKPWNANLDSFFDLLRYSKPVSSKTTDLILFTKISIESFVFVEGCSNKKLSIPSEEIL